MKLNKAKHEEALRFHSSMSELTGILLKCYDLVLGILIGEFPGPALVLRSVGLVEVGADGESERRIDEVVLCTHMSARSGSSGLGSVRSELIDRRTDGCKN